MADSHTGPFGQEADPTTLELRSRGRWPLPPGRRVAIVGTHHSTPYGEAVAEHMAEELARAGVAVIAGLPASIEAAAHEGALSVGGYTAAVLGTGVDIVYPARADLAARILAGGGTLLSPFRDGTHARHSNIVRRNWVIAGLADLVVVVESTEASSAMVTAEAARALRKPLMAVPGSILSPSSMGCHTLLRDGGARMVRNAADVLDELAAREPRSRADAEVP